MFAALAEPIDAITKTSTGPSTARGEASRANGRLSHGPTLLEGKARSRRNGCKEGLTGAGIVLPPAAATEVERREAKLVHDFGPRNAVERELVRQMALGAWRGEVLAMRIIQHDARMNAARFANWEQDEQLAAAELGRRLGDDPEGAVIRLKRSSAGCDWLIGRLRLLGNDLSTAAEGGPGCTWTDADLALALDLLGRPAELRHLDDQAARLESLRAQARSGSDEGVTELRGIIAEEIAELERRREEVWEGVEQPRLQDWCSGLEIDLGPEGTRLRRYEMAADRLFRSAWTKLERQRKERDEPLIQRYECGFAAEHAARPDPPAEPLSEPVPPAPAPVRPESAVPAPAPVRPESAVPAPAPVRPESAVPAPAPVRPESAVPAPAGLDDPPTVLDFWIGGPPRPGISPGCLFQNKTNPTPSRPANGGRAARRRNLP